MVSPVGNSPQQNRNVQRRIRRVHKPISHVRSRPLGGTIQEINSYPTFLKAGSSDSIDHMPRCDQIRLRRASLPGDVSTEPKGRPYKAIRLIVHSHGHKGHTLFDAFVDSQRDDRSFLRIYADRQDVFELARSQREMMSLSGSPISKAFCPERARRPAAAVSGGSADRASVGRSLVASRLMPAATWMLLGCKNSGRRYSPLRTRSSARRFSA